MSIIMASNSLFTPKPAGTVNISASNSSSRVALARGTNPQVRVSNLDATTAVFIEFGTSSVVAVAATGIPIRPGETAGFTLSDSVTHVAAITASSTATVYFTPGVGS